MARAIASSLLFLGCRHSPEAYFTNPARGCRPLCTVGSGWPPKRDRNACFSGRRALERASPACSAVAPAHRRLLLPKPPCCHTLPGSPGSRPLLADQVAHENHRSMTAQAAPAARADVQAVQQGPRGAFIVFEGADRAGKSTQCQMLVEHLQVRRALTPVPLNCLHCPACTHNEPTRSARTASPPSASTCPPACAGLWRGCRAVALPRPHHRHRQDDQLLPYQPVGDR